MKSWSSLLAPAVRRRTALHVNPGEVKAVCATGIRKGSVTKGTLLREWTWVSHADLSQFWITFKSRGFNLVPWVGAGDKGTKWNPPSSFLCLMNTPTQPSNPCIWFPFFLFLPLLLQIHSCCCELKGQPWGQRCARRWLRCVPPPSSPPSRLKVTVPPCPFARVPRETTHQAQAAASPLSFWMSLLHLLSFSPSEERLSFFAQLLLCSVSPGWSVKM